MIKILFAEDDNNLRAVIEESLCDEGYKVCGCNNGLVALNAFLNEPFDIVITDVMMPKMDGNELALEIRKLNKNIPLIMLTALGAIYDKENGFDSGADDYLVKPISLKELSIRVKAMLRRAKIYSESVIKLPNSTLNFNSKTLAINGKEIELTKKEFALLFKLLTNPNTVFSREQLMQSIWGYDDNLTDRAVDTHMSRLKAKVKCSDFEILTVYGIGYKAVIKESI